MQIVFDTNVLLAESPEIKEFVTEVITEIIHYNPHPGEPLNGLTIAIDEEGEIFKEYQQTFYDLYSKGAIDRISPLGLIYEHIKRNQSSTQHQPGPVIKLKSAFGKTSDLEFLVDNSCGLPIEPSMFGIVVNYPKSTYVFHMGNFQGIKPRGYPAIYNQIRHRYLQYNEYTRILLKTLIEDGPFPGHYNGLSRLLEAIRVCGAPLEGERYEFKGTVIKHNKDTNERIDTGVLSNSVLEDLPKTVCSMLNKNGGYIFLGVREKPNFEITGFNCTEQNSSADDIQKEIEHRLSSHIFPYDSQKIIIDFVKGIPTPTLSPHRMVMAIQVKRKNRAEDPYRANGNTGKKRKMKYHERAIWTRCASSVRLVPER